MQHELFKVVAFWLVLLLVLGGCASTVQTEKPSEEKEEFYLYESRERWLLTSPLPMDKSYSQLSEKQQKMLRTFYVDLGKKDRPPFPLAGTKSLYKAVVDTQHIVPRNHHRSWGGLFSQNGGVRRGNLAAIATISAFGNAEKVEVLESPAKKIEDATIAILFNTKFEPGTCDGTPCNMEYFFQIKTSGINRRGEVVYTVFGPDEIK